MSSLSDQLRAECYEMWVDVPTTLMREAADRIDALETALRRIGEFSDEPEARMAREALGATP